MALTIAAKIQALDAIQPTLMSIHSGPPGASGNDNLIGSALPCTYSAAANVSGNAQRALSGSVSFPVPAGVTVTHTITKNSGGVVLDLHALAAPETYTNPNGTHTVTSSTITLS